MKLLFVLTYYYPHWTGLTRYAQRLAEGLAGRGHEVTVLATLHQPELKPTENVGGVKVVRKPVLFRLSRTAVSPTFLAALWQEIRRNDCVVAYLPLAECAIVSIVARLLGKKLYLVHNGDLVLPRGAINRVIERFYYHSTDLAIRISDGIILQTEDYGRHSALLSRWTSRWRVLLPLYPPLRKSEEDVRRLERSLGLGEGYRVGFAGRFVEEKGFDYLLKAIPLIRSTLPAAKFLFAGETNLPYEDFYQRNRHLIEQNKDSLVLLGLLTEEEMETFYRLCDVFVVSSRSDCFPSTQVEAMRVGTPVVVTDIPGARWPVSATGMGMVVAARDEAALASGTVQVLTHRSEYVKRDAVERLFDNEKTLDSYEQLFSDRK